MKAQQLEVDEQQVHLGVAHSLADTQGRAVHAVYARLNGCQGIRKTKTSIPMSVPIELHILAANGNNFLLGKPDQCPHAVRCGMTHGVGQADAASASSNGGQVERFEGLGDVPGSWSSVTNMTGSPSFTANVTASSDTFSIRSSVHPSAYCRTCELPMNGAGFDGDAYPLGYLCNRAHVADHRPGRTIGRDGEL